MHSTITMPGTTLSLTPVPCLQGRRWRVVTAGGHVLGTVTRVRTDPGTRRERTRWVPATGEHDTDGPQFMTRAAAVANLIERHTR